VGGRVFFAAFLKKLRTLKVYDPNPSDDDDVFIDELRKTRDRPTAAELA